MTKRLQNWLANDLAANCWTDTKPHRSSSSRHQFIPNRRRHDLFSKLEMGKNALLEDAESAKHGWY